MRSLGQIPAVMDEAEAYTNLSEALRIAEAACRQLAFMRQGEQSAALWMVMAGQMGQAKQQVLKLMHSSARKRIMLAS